MGRFDYADLRGTIRDPAEHEPLDCPRGIKCGDAYQCADHDICAADTAPACTCTFEYPQCVCRGSTASGEVKPGETRLLVQGIRELLDRVTTDTASAMDYVLFGELSMWWELQGKHDATRRRSASSSHPSGKVGK